MSTYGSSACWRGPRLPLGGKSLLFFGEVFQHFVCLDLKFPEESGAKAGAQGAVHSITSARHHNAPNTRVIMASIERIPPRTFEPGLINFEPCGKVHRRRVQRNADISEIAGGVARGNIHATAKRDRKMRKVTTNTDLLRVSLRRGASGVRLLVIKPQPIVNVIDDFLDAQPLPLDPKRFQASWDSLSVSSRRLLLRAPTWPVRKCHANRLEPPANADYLFRPDSAGRALSEDQNHRRVVEEFKGHAADLKAVLGRAGKTTLRDARSPLPAAVDRSRAELFH